MWNINVGQTFIYWKIPTQDEEDCTSLPDDAVQKSLWYIEDMLKGCSLLAFRCRYIKMAQNF